MLAGAALNQVDVPSDLLCFATADQNTAFSHIRVPPWWHRYQCGPRVRARELPADWWAGKYRPDQWLRPQYFRLAMGHIYAVLVLSVINARIMQAVRASWKKFGELAFLNDAEVCKAGVVITERQAAAYVHVDDFGLIAHSDQAANELARLR